VVDSGRRRRGSCILANAAIDADANEGGPPRGRRARKRRWAAPCLASPRPCPMASCEIPSLPGMPSGIKISADGRGQIAGGVKIPPIASRSGSRRFAQMSDAPRRFLRASNNDAATPISAKKHRQAARENLTGRRPPSSAIPAIAKTSRKLDAQFTKACRANSTFSCKTAKELGQAIDHSHGPGRGGANQALSKRLQAHACKCKTNSNVQNRRGAETRRPA